MWYPERGRKPKDKTAVMGGDWDRVLERGLNWSSKYEPPTGVETGMIPLQNYAFYQAARARFIDGARWSDTGWFAWMKATAPARYETEAAITERLALLDRLFEEPRSRHLATGPADRPRVNIGRSGRVAIDDGRHRLVVAAVAGVASLEVALSFVHPEADPNPAVAQVIGANPAPLHPLRRVLGRLCQPKPR